MPTFARDQAWLALKKRVDALAKGYRQNIGIIGPLGLGKTHLLHAAFQDFSSYPELIAAYIQAEVFDSEQLSDRWIGALLTGYLISERLPETPGDIDSLISACESRLPRTVQAARHIQKMLRKERSAEFVQELFGLSGVLSEETGKKILLMLDEFQEIDRLPVPDPFVLLGRQIMVEKDTLYLVSSSKPERAREIFREKLSLLFGNFEVIELQPFHFQETLDFLDFHFPNADFTLEQKKLLIALTNGEPLYLDLLADRLKFYLSAEGSSIVSDHLLFTAFHEELFDRKGRIALIFEKVLHPILRYQKDHVPYLRGLLAVAEGNQRLSSISSYISRKPAEAKKILSRLVQEDLVSKKGTMYVMEDPLFRFWLREVFKRRSEQYHPDPSRMAGAFYRALKEFHEKMQHEEGRELTFTLERLLKEFRNDIADLQGKKYRCPQFSEITYRPSNGRFCTVIAKSAKTRWVCQITRSPVQEEDVLAFQEEMKRLRNPVHCRIMITLGGIDLNAKLRAQAEKIHLWNLRDFNMLLELYNLPKLILVDPAPSDLAAVEPVLNG